MKRIGFGLLKTTMALLLLGSMGLAIYVNHLGDSFDPVQEVQKVHGGNGRDDALDMAWQGFSSNPGAVANVHTLL